MPSPCLRYFPPFPPALIRSLSNLLFPMALLLCMHPLDVALPWQLGVLVNILSWFQTDRIGGFEPLETRIDPGLNPFKIRV